MSPEREAVICADLHGEWKAPFPAMEERAVVFGYYAVDKVCVDEEVVLMTGDKMSL